jgi:Na+/H+ antiporter NhaD/arsenite permease-like protein
MTGSLFDVIVVLVLLTAVFVVFIGEWLPPDMVALSTAAILLLTGILSTDDVLSVFSNNAVATVAAMFVLSAALERTGVVEAMGDAATASSVSIGCWLFRSWSPSPSEPRLSSTTRRWW